MTSPGCGPSSATPVSLTRYQVLEPGGRGTCQVERLARADERRASRYRSGRSRASPRPTYTISRRSTHAGWRAAASRWTRSRPAKSRCSTADLVTATRSRSLTPASKPPEMADPDAQIQSDQVVAQLASKLLGHELNDRTDRRIHRRRVFSHAATVNFWVRMGTTGDARGVVAGGIRDVVRLADRFRVLPATPRRAIACHAVRRSPVVSAGSAR